MGTSDQFFDQLAMIDKVLRAAIRIHQRDGVGIDSQLMVQRVEDMLQMHRAVFGTSPSRLVEPMACP